jgi:hypothetical protein
MRGPVHWNHTVLRLARRQILFCLILLTLLGVPFAQSASASKAWCRTDPVIVVNGQVTDVFVAGPLTALLQVTGPTQILVTVPVGADAWLLLSDVGFGQGVSVSFAESSELSTTNSGTEIRVEVFVPANDESMPVRVEVAPRILGILWPASAEGTSNNWIAMETRV